MTEITETTDLRALLRDLRSAGWRHTVKWEDLSGRDADGAPWGEPTEVHQWRHGTARVELWRDESRVSGFVNYEPRADEGHDFDSVSVGYQWVERQGISGLRALAATLGLVPAVPAGGAQNAPTAEQIRAAHFDCAGRGCVECDQDLRDAAARGVSQ